MSAENTSPQFYYPNVTSTPGQAKRPEKPEGFRIPLLYMAAIYTVSKVKIGPHFHPNADELAYFTGGEGTVGITLPGGENLEYQVAAGDVVVFPQGYPHFFVNNNGEDEPLTFLAFFNNPEFALINSSTVPVIEGGDA